MKHVLTVPLLVGFLLCQAVAAAGLVEWGSEESSVRLSRSAHKADFFRLSNVYISREQDIFCGPVSLAIVLNALRLGKQLRQLAQALSAYELEVRIRVVDEETNDEVIKRELAKNLAVPGDYVLVNYHRKALGQKGGGHVSFLGAYDEASDSFLIMDVNPNRAPGVWVSAVDLIKAMRTFDTVENRGYLLIAEGR